MHTSFASAPAGVNALRSWAWLVGYRPFGSDVEALWDGRPEHIGHFINGVVAWSRGGQGGALGASGQLGTALTTWQMDTLAKIHARETLRSLNPPSLGAMPNYQNTAKVAGTNFANAVQKMATGCTALQWDILDTASKDAFVMAAACLSSWYMHLGANKIPDFYADLNGLKCAAFIAKWGMDIAGTRTSCYVAGDWAYQSAAALDSADINPFKPQPVAAPPPPPPKPAPPGTFKTFTSVLLAIGTRLVARELLRAGAYVPSGTAAAQDAATTEASNLLQAIGSSACMKTGLAATPVDETMLAGVACIAYTYARLDADARKAVMSSLRTVSDCTLLGPKISAVFPASASACPPGLVSDAAYASYAALLASPLDPNPAAAPAQEPPKPLALTTDEWCVLGQIFMRELLRRQILSAPAGTRTNPLEAAGASTAAASAAAEALLAAYKADTCITANGFKSSGKLVPHAAAAAGYWYAQQGDQKRQAGLEAIRGYAAAGCPTIDWVARAATSTPAEVAADAAYGLPIPCDSSWSAFGLWKAPTATAGAGQGAGASQEAAAAVTGKDAGAATAQGGAPPASKMKMGLIVAGGLAAVGIAVAVGVKYYRKREAAPEASS